MRVRSSLGGKVYTNNNQVVIAIRDKGSHDFEDKFGSFSCSLSFRTRQEVPGGLAGFPNKFRFGEQKVQIRRIEGTPKKM